MRYSHETISAERMENDMADNGHLMSNMLTVREVSRLLHVHSNTLRRWSDQGIIKATALAPVVIADSEPRTSLSCFTWESRGIPVTRD
jgi:transposase-like protein